MLPEGYVLHDDVLATLPSERRENILAKSRRLVLASELKDLREKRQMTQKQVADVMGVARPTVNQLEKRGGNIRFSTLKRYVEAVGGSLEVSVRLPSGVTRLRLTI